MTIPRNCPKQVYARDEDGNLMRGISCGRDVEFEIRDDYYAESYYRCGFHAGRARAGRTTVHAIDIVTGECVSCKSTVGVGKCPHMDPDKCPECGSPR